VSHAVPQYCSIFDRSSFIIKYKNKWITWPFYYQGH
jgi:hypothetical protein